MFKVNHHQLGRGSEYIALFLGPKYRGHIIEQTSNCSLGLHNWVSWFQVNCHLMTNITKQPPSSLDSPFLVDELVGSPSGNEAIFYELASYKSRWWIGEIIASRDGRNPPSEGNMSDVPLEGFITPPNCRDRNISTKNPLAYCKPAQSN